MLLAKYMGISTIVGLFLVAGAINASDEFYEQPRFSNGTKFVFKYTKDVFNTPQEKYTKVLNYRGLENPDGPLYNFGKFLVTSSLVHIKKSSGRLSDPTPAVLFPLKKGAKWKYEDSFQAGNDCGMMTDYMTAKVDKKMTTVTIAGIDYAGIWIKHKGYWKSEKKCGNGKKGARLRGYLYVPEIGFWVEEYSKRYLADVNGQRGDIYFEKQAKMTKIKLGK